LSIATPAARRRAIERGEANPRFIVTSLKAGAWSARTLTVDGWGGAGGASASHEIRLLADLLLT
jgi:hypothetical protein